MASVEFNAFALFSFLLFLVVSVGCHWHRIEQKGKSINHLSHALIRAGILGLIAWIDAENYLHGLSIGIYWAALFWLGFDALLNLARGKNLFYPSELDLVNRAGFFDNLFRERPLLYLGIKLGALTFGWLACGLFDGAGDFQPVLLSGLGWMILSGILALLLITVLLDGKLAKWYRDRWIYTLPASAVVIGLNAYLAVSSRPRELPEPEWWDIYSLPGILGVGLWVFLLVRAVRRS